jgi:hypothetical protein
MEHFLKDCNTEIFFQNFKFFGLRMMVHTCNSSCLGSGGKEDHGPRLALSRSERLYLKSKLKAKESKGHGSSGEHWQLNSIPSTVPFSPPKFKCFTYSFAMVYLTLMPAALLNTGDLEVTKTQLQNLRILILNRDPELPISLVGFKSKSCHVLSLSFIGSEKQVFMLVQKELTHIKEINIVGWSRCILERTPVVWRNDAYQ